MLSPAEASEEFRHGIVKCLQAVFQGLQPCKSLSCSCKYVLPSPFSILKQAPEDLYQGYGYIGVEEDEAGEMEIVEYAAPEICPLGYLQSVEMAPAIGHLLSLLLQVCAPAKLSFTFDINWPGGSFCLVFPGSDASIDCLSMDFYTLDRR